MQPSYIKKGPRKTGIQMKESCRMWVRFANTLQRNFIQQTKFAIYWYAQKMYKCQYNVRIHTLNATVQFTSSAQQLNFKARL